MLRAFVRLVCLPGFFLACVVCGSLGAAPITVRVEDAGKAISPDLFGIFFEDLNYATDGGLYAELIQNRSFEYQAIEQPTWNNLTSWELVTRGGGKGALKVGAAFPLHANNPHYADLAAEIPGEGVGLTNSGFDGIPVRAGERYELSFSVRENHFARRWQDIGKQGPLPLVARLEGKSGAVLAEANFEVTAREWHRVSATLTANQTDASARLVLLLRGQGGIALDEISLFPQKTFRNRANGLRADLAQTIADLKPRFMRFPGGCLVHGNGLGNIYRWQDTIGPIEQRRQQANLWGYHQSVGLGYFEYFQFCEDIGAEPLPVVAAGVCCQNSGQGIGQAGLPLSEIDAYIQDVLDLVEWANGPATSPWGAKRAAAGHPEPFHFKYLGIGNEDQITPVFRERFQLIHDAIKAKHPEITLIGTAGPFPDGEDFEAGWKIADELKVAMLDEHYYKTPDWFWENLTRYDSYDRAKSKVYVGEYAAHDDKRRNTLRSALAEAAFLTSLERNGDIVHFASYAPLLARRGHTQWTPDLIYFNATDVFPTLNYTVQKLFGENRGDTYLPTTIEASDKKLRLAASTVRDSHTGEVILKIVNGSDAAQSLQFKLAGGKTFPSNATVTTFAAADANLVNEDGQPAAVTPQTTTRSFAAEESYDVPANSLTIIRLK
jgi:alpha-L-arabinofuranosidase